MEHALKPMKISSDESLFLLSDIQPVSVPKNTEFLESCKLLSTAPGCVSLASGQPCS